MKEPWRQLVSDDGAVALALHRFTGADPASSNTDDPPEFLPPVVLLSHATGFHAHCYRAVAAALPAEWTAIGLDHRGHGYTAPDPSSEHLDGQPSVDWSLFGADAAATARWLRLQYGTDRLIGFGHSMGASALVTAAARNPELFAALVLFEPIAPSGFVPADSGDGTVDSGSEQPINPEGSELAAGAARRRRTFESVNAAIENYASKPPFSMIAPEVLRDYVTHGFAPAAEGITLRCVPEYEAATFNSAMTNGAWEAMPDIKTPTIVASGMVEADQPSAWTAAITNRIPGAELVVFDDQNHFGPFTEPAANAALIEHAAELG